MKKKVILILCLVLAAALIVTVHYLTKKVHYNEPDANGNTSGNLMNGGEFCEFDGKIYFSNYLDEGTLYVMDETLENQKKISDEIVSDLNVAGKYIIYSRRNNKRDNQGSILIFDTMGAYRIRQKGGRTTQLFDDYTGMVHQYGNYVYYQHYTEDELLTLYQVKIDDTEEKQLTKEPVVPAAIDNGILYYSGIDEDHFIHKMNLSNGSSETIYEGNCSNVIDCGSYLYFTDLSNNNGISRIRKDGSDYEQLVSEMCSSFNLSLDGSVLYYQIDGSDNNRLCRMLLHNGKESVIREGDFNSIHTTSHYVFFKDFHSGNYYYMDDAGNVNQFWPEVEED